MSRVLVAGVYPPVPGRAAEATLAAVRWHLAAGDEVVVLSPRVSAAHRHGPLEGHRAGPTLAAAVAEEGADDVTLCVSADVPFGAAARRSGPRAGRRLRRALGPVGRLQVVVAEAPGAPVAALRALWPAVAVVWVAPGQDPAEWARRLDAPPGLVAVAPFGWPGDPPPAPVTAAGPPERMPARHRARLVAAYARHPQRIPPWALHRTRVALGPHLRPVLVRLGLRPARPG